MEIEGVRLNSSRRGNRDDRQTSRVGSPLSNYTQTQVDGATGSPGRLSELQFIGSLCSNGGKFNGLISTLPL